MSVPGGPTPWWDAHVWDRDDAAIGLHWRYQPIMRILQRPLCWLGRHLQGPCGICARGCSYDPDRPRKRVA